MDRFPDRVRAMVLDGAVDPAEDTVDSIIQQMAGFQTAFTDYAADCAKSAGCPLGTGPAQWVNRFHQLVDPLVARPGLLSVGPDLVLILALALLVSGAGLLVAGMRRQHGNGDGDGEDAGAVV